MFYSLHGLHPLLTTIRLLRGIIMGECFDLTFFVDKAKINEKQDEELILGLLNISHGRNQLYEHHFPLFSGREVFFEVYPESDFIGYWIAITELTFTKKNFNAKLNQILEVVDTCLDKMPQIMFATGIYQMTYYYIQEVKRIADFNKTIFSNFPLLFFREGNEYGFRSTQKYGNISCVVNLRENVQNIFANPIKELMEDEGLTFDEAQKRAKWNE